MLTHTVPKNRVADFLKKVVSAKVYTLDNYFHGEPVTDFDRMREWAVKLQGKVRVDKTAYTGEIYYHGNHWVEFSYAD